MSKIVKGIKKAVKKVFKGVKKVFKKIVKSTIGKVLLAAVVIYTGGVLMGAWGSTGPMSGLFGSWSGTATAATTGAEVAGATASTAAETAGVLQGGSTLASPTATASETAGAL